MVDKTIDPTEAVSAINERLKEIGVKARAETVSNVSNGKYAVTLKNCDLATIDKTRGLRERSSVVYRDALTRSGLDLATTSVSKAKPAELFKRAIESYYEKDVYGSYIDALTNFASKGFRNDCDDLNIKAFYDGWCFGVGFQGLLRRIFFDFFRVGMVRTFRVLGKYEPSVGIIEPNKKFMGPKTKDLAMKALGAKKNIWSKAYIPIRYTVLNPLSYEIPESSMFVNSTKVKIPASALKNLGDLLKKSGSDLSPEEKAIISSLPNDVKNAAKNKKDLILDESVIGKVDYRKMDYELYPKPKGSRAFDSLEFKEHLVNADYSTLDGATSYILVITVGNDEYPITDDNILAQVADLFDTEAKSFDVVYNHTLKVEKITTPEMAEILGEDKYRQVSKDISGAMGFARALIDGTEVLNNATASVAVKNVIEEINYARDEIRDWIYTEYKIIAEAMEFPIFPSVRWDNFVLRDDLAVKSLLQGLADRRIVSYRTIIDELGYNFNNELAQMEEEVKLVKSGVFGILGSPYQQSSRTPSSPSSQVQETQKTPKGTPSEGRPKKKEGDASKASVSEEDLESVMDEVGGKGALEILLKLSDKILLLGEDDREELLNNVTELIRKS